MSAFVHLSKFESVLAPGAEWRLRAPLWAVLQLQRGFAYACTERANEELLPAGVLIIPPQSALTLLASRLGEANLRAFGLKAGALVGLLTATERMCLEGHVAQECAPFRQLPASHPLAACMSCLFQNANTPSLPDRLAFVHAFAEWLAPFLSQATRKKADQAGQNPKARLQGFISQVPESELASLSLSEMARHLCCCDRHASRLFYDLFGCSFRSYINGLRLNKACQLLVDAEQKISDVALDSGHTSLAQFNYAFKNRFQMSPSQWRARQLARKATPSEAIRLAIMA